MRIVAGKYRGLHLVSPKGRRVRPTADRVREAIFNILGIDLSDLWVLDLFAGSGVIGLEAKSRGVAKLISIESERTACQAMQKIQQAWHIDDWTVQAGKLPQSLPPAQHFDLIFADPPYAKGLAEQVPAWLEKAGISYQVLVIEETSRITPKWKNNFIPTKQRKYSETTLYFFEPGAE